MSSWRAAHAKRQGADFERGTNAARPDCALLKERITVMMSGMDNQNTHVQRPDSLALVSADLYASPEITPFPAVCFEVGRFDPFL
jgi:hypothetical protein